VINSNLGPISHRFRDTAIYSFKLSTENCGQTAADGDMVTINSLQKVAINHYDLPFSHNTSVTDDGRTERWTDDDNHVNSSTVT